LDLAEFLAPLLLLTLPLSLAVGNTKLLIFCTLISDLRLAPEAILTYSTYFISSIIWLPSASRVVMLAELFVLFNTLFFQEEIELYFDA
jgi:hypothetical protein